MGLEITSLADIPAGTGLGSSGSFTTALLKALHQYRGDIVSMRTLAEEACTIEIDKLGEHIGKQDQYIASYGGIISMTIHKDGYVWVEPLAISNETLEDNLAMFFTGFSHSASNVLQDQDKKSKEKNDEMLNNLHRVKQMGYDSKEALEKGDLNTFAEIMNEHWQNKRKRSRGMSNSQIDEWYEYALHNGALGGKLIGAGGGGFLLFYCVDKVRLRDSGLTGEVHRRFCDERKDMRKFAGRGSYGGTGEPFEGENKGLPQIFDRNRWKTFFRVSVGIDDPCRLPTFFVLHWIPC